MIRQERGRVEEKMGEGKMVVNQEKTPVKAGVHHNRYPAKVSVEAGERLQGYG